MQNRFVVPPLMTLGFWGLLKARKEIDFFLSSYHGFRNLKNVDPARKRAFEIVTTETSSCN